MSLRISFDLAGFWGPETTQSPVTCAFLVRTIRSIAVLIARLGELSRVTSFVELGICRALVALALQRFVFASRKQ